MDDTENIYVASNKTARKNKYLAVFYVKSSFRLDKSCFRNIIYIERVKERLEE